MPRPRPQSVILPDPGENALLLVLRVRGRRRHARAVADVAAQVPALTSRLADERRVQVGSAIAFGRKMWKAISPQARPEGFAKFRRLERGERCAPATGGDLLLHVASREAGVCFDLARRLRELLGDRARVMDEVRGFRYRDYRDLTGFTDGTENPSGSARAHYALLPPAHPFAGGSFVLAMRFVHDLVRWDALAVDYQEQVIGRTKETSRELPERMKPPTAHIARTEIYEANEKLRIVRHSFPYGDSSEHGLYFLAYTNDLGITTRMLTRMIGTAPDGGHDALLDYTRPVSGAHFFAPSLSTLRSL